MINVKSISFPNTIEESKQNTYTVGNSVDEIIQIGKSGEMAPINWFQIIKGGNVIAEIKESVCDVYGKDKI